MTAEPLISEKRCTSEDEYEGIRYTVLIGSAEKYLYRIGGKWYVEPIQTEVDTG